MPVRVIITAGPTADCTKAVQLIEGLDAQYLLADRGYLIGAQIIVYRT